MKRFEKSRLPSASPIGGMMTSPTSEVTIFPNARPIMMPTAISIILPRAMNSLNSFNMPGTLQSRCDGTAETRPARRPVDAPETVRYPLRKRCTSFTAQHRFDDSGPKVNPVPRGSLAKEQRLRGHTVEILKVTQTNTDQSKTLLRAQGDSVSQR